MPKILIVEDDETTRLSLQDILENENYQVESVGNGRDAVGLIDLSDFDLAIVDWNLPELPGIELCRYIARKKRDCRVILLTGKGSVDEKEEGLNSGADDYITKPYVARELIARVKAVLRRSGPIIEDTICVKDVVIDCVRRRVTSHGRDVELNNSEFAILELLCRHKGTVYSLDTLINYAWPSERNVTHDAVRQSIKRIREKIGSSQDIIVTIPRSGYRVD